MPGGVKIMGSPNVARNNGDDKLDDSGDALVQYLDRLKIQALGGGPQASDEDSEGLDNTILTENKPRAKYNPQAQAAKSALTNNHPEEVSLFIYPDHSLLVFFLNSEVLGGWSRLFNISM